MGKRKSHLLLQPANTLETTVDMYPAVDLDQLRMKWLPRHTKLKWFATGPLEWMNLDLNDPKILHGLEKEEDRLSKAILEVFEALFPEPVKPAEFRNDSENFRMLVVGFGPGRRIEKYIERAQQLGGACYGIDALQEWLPFLYGWLSKTKYASELHKFQQGLATELTKIFPRNHFDVVTWERLGNHILDEQEWEFAVHEAVTVLKPNGIFQLAESTLELKDPAREVNPQSSVFRSIQHYKRVLGPRMGLIEELVKTAKYASDNYFIGPFRKASKPSKGR